MPASATSSIQSTTQEFIDIYDITNDLVIMKDGSTALVLTVDAMNFGLLAEEEQDAVMYAYAGLLNSLNYSIQIVIRSQTKDATNYLNLLKDQEQTASSTQKKQFIREYREFVANLIRERNVLDKKFYIAIPASSLEMGLVPPSTVIPGVKKTDISTVERSVILDKAKTILEPKRDHLISQFSRLGLYARQLQTQEIIQLFYTSYNPEAAEGQQITDSNNYVTPLVQASTHNPSAPPAVTVSPGAVVAPNIPVTQPAVVATPPQQPVESEIPPAPIYSTPNLAPAPPNEAPPIDPVLLTDRDMYQQPPAITTMPLPEDVQMRVDAFNAPPTAPAAVVEPQVLEVNPSTAVQETPIYSAAPVAAPVVPSQPVTAAAPNMPPAPIAQPAPVMAAPSPMAPPVSATTNFAAGNTLPLPSLPSIPEIK